MDEVVNEGTAELGETEVPEGPVEFDYSMDPDGEESEAGSEDVGADDGSDPEGRTSSTAPEGVADDGTQPEATPPLPAATPQEDRLAALERRANEAEARLQRALSHLPEQSGTPTGPPKPKEKLQTAQDVAEYTEWYIAERDKHTRAQASLDAQAAASEQRARGILNQSALGQGNDYDALISRHVEPLETANPDMRRLFGSMQDPALARYTFAFIRELAGNFGGDPVKTFNEIRKAMGARREGARDIVKKIEEAAKSGADKIRSRASRPGKTPGGKMGPKDIERLTNKEYRALERQVYGS